MSGTFCSTKRNIPAGTVISLIFFSVNSIGWSKQFAPSPEATTSRKALPAPLYKEQIITSVWESCAGEHGHEGRADVKQLRPAQLVQRDHWCWTLLGGEHRRSSETHLVGLMEQGVN